MGREWGQVGHAEDRVGPQPCGRRCWRLPPAAAATRAAADEPAVQHQRARTNSPSCRRRGWKCPGSCRPARTDAGRRQPDRSAPDGRCDRGLGRQPVGTVRAAMPGWSPMPRGMACSRHPADPGRRRPGLSPDPWRASCWNAVQGQHLLQGLSRLVAGRPCRTCPLARSRRAPPRRPRPRTAATDPILSHLRGRVCRWRHS